MTKFVIVNHKSYSLRGLASKYNLIPSTVSRLYKKGFRDAELLQQAKKSTRKSIVINGKTFSSKRAAAIYYQIPYTTFFRHLKNGDLEEKLELKKKAV